MFHVAFLFGSPFFSPSYTHTLSKLPVFFPNSEVPTTKRGEIRSLTQEWWSCCWREEQIFIRSLLGLVLRLGKGFSDRIYRSRGPFSRKFFAVFLPKKGGSAYCFQTWTVENALAFSKRQTPPFLSKHQRFQGEKLAKKTQGVDSKQNTPTLSDTVSFVHSRLVLWISSIT